MSEPSPVAEALPPRPKRRLRWWGAAGVFGVAVIVVFVSLNDRSERELREAVAEADRLDPGWRSADVDAPAEPIPDEENAALHVLAARRLMPRGVWPPFAARPGAPWVVGTLGSLPPPVQLTDAVAGEIKTQLTDLEPALMEARKLKSLSRGRYPVGYGLTTGGVRVDMETSNAVRSLLAWEAAAQAQDGRPGDALASGRAVLVVGRSLGDEPGWQPFLDRVYTQADAVRSIERTLAQGTPGPEELRATQELLEDEAGQPVLLNALRGQRAAVFRDMSAALGRANGGSTLGRLRALATRPIRARELRSEQAQVLRKATECVEIAKSPLDEQRERLARVRVAKPKGQDDLGLRLWYFTGPVEDHLHYQAVLRCAITGLALERYRHDTGHWPERLDELAPGYLKLAPLSPFDGQPLRFKRLADGIVVYAVVPEDGGDFGTFPMMGRGEGRETENAFRLWDADSRRQPPAEVLLMPKPAD